MPILSYGRALTHHAERQPDAPTLICEDRSVTRAELDRGSNRLARAFAERGVGHGDFVTLALANGVGFVEACFACWKLGAVPQPISSRLPFSERVAIIAQADPKLILGAEPGEHGDRPALAADFDSSSYDESGLPDAVSPHRQALASGGSTGRPKVIVDALAAEVDPEEAFYGNEPGSTVLIPGPLFHAGPFINCHVTVLIGGTAILMQRFDPARTLELIDRHGVQWVNLVPTMMHRIWRLPEDQRNSYDLSSLRRVMASGAACPAWLKRNWIEWIGAERVWEAYGATERIGGTVISGTDWLAHPGSVGKPTHGRKLRVMDESEKECAPGEVGEIYFMPPGGKGSTYSYIGAQAQSTDDGWETLGDMGYLDEDGFLYLVDRRTDMIVTGGENVYPAEIEAALDAHPAVQSSAAIGLPEDDLGQRVHAIVETSRPVGEDELREHLAEHLARYKIPRSFEFVNEPLRDDAGKLRRSRLREERIGRGSSPTT